MTVAAVTTVRLIEPEQAPLLARPYYAGGDPGPIVIRGDTAATA